MLTENQQRCLDACYAEAARRGWSARELIALAIAESQLGLLLENPNDSEWGSAGPWHQNLPLSPEAAERFPDWRIGDPIPLPKSDPWVQALIQKYKTDFAHAAKVAADRLALFRNGAYGYTWEPNTEEGFVAAAASYNGGSNPYASPVRWLYTIGWQQAQAYPETRSGPVDELEALRAEKDALVQRLGYLHGDVVAAFRKEIATMKAELTATAERLNAAAASLEAFEAAANTLETQSQAL